MVCQAGEMFWESICMLACECVFKTAPAFVQRISPELSWPANQFVHIPVNPLNPWLNDLLAKKFCKSLIRIWKKFA